MRVHAPLQVVRLHAALERNQLLHRRRAQQPRRLHAATARTHVRTHARAHARNATEFREGSDATLLLRFCDTHANANGNAHRCVGRCRWARQRSSWRTESIGASCSAAHTQKVNRGGDCIGEPSECADLCKPPFHLSRTMMGPVSEKLNSRRYSESVSNNNEPSPLMNCSNLVINRNEPHRAPAHSPTGCR